MTVIVKNRLLNYGDAIIYQDVDWFKFSIDSVLLANFVTIRLRDKKIIDLCSGNAPIPMLLSFKTKSKIYGIELQKEVYDLGVRSIIENKMDSQIDFINGNIKDVGNLFCSDSFDVVVCNPPYFRVNKNSYLTENKIKRVARHEVEVNLSDIFSSAKYLLKTGGIFAMVHRPERFVEIIYGMREVGIEPKRVQFVYPKDGCECNMLLIEGIKNGSVGLKILPPLVLHSIDGTYRDEIRKYFEL